ARSTDPSRDLLRRVLIGPDHRPAVSLREPEQGLGPPRLAVLALVQLVRDHDELPPSEDRVDLLFSLLEDLVVAPQDEVGRLVELDQLRWIERRVPFERD